jgi:hypothetical protein
MGSQSQEVGVFAEKEGHFPNFDVFVFLQMGQQIVVRFSETKGSFSFDQVSVFETGGHPQRHVFGDHFLSNFDVVSGLVTG